MCLLGNKTALATRLVNYHSKCGETDSSSTDSESSSDGDDGFDLFDDE